MAGLSCVSGFFKTLPLKLLTVKAQGLGIFFESAIEDTKMAFLFGDPIFLISMLSGGYLTQALPPWFTWAKYLSIIYYPSSSLSIILFGDMEPIACNTTSASAFSNVIIMTRSDYKPVYDILLSG